MSDEYKRQIDTWIKISLIVGPLVSAGVSWGVIKTTLMGIDARVVKVEQWISVQTSAMVDSAKAAGQSSEQQHEMNRRLERIEVILDSRLSRR